MDYVLVMKISADDEMTPEQIREAIYDACEDVPFAFDVDTIAPN